MSDLRFEPTGEKGQGGLVYGAVSPTGEVFRLTPWKYSDRRGWRVERDGEMLGSRGSKAAAEALARDGA